MENSPSLGPARSDRNGREIVAGHEFADPLAGTFGKTNIPICKNSAKLARFLDDRNSADPMMLHELESLGKRLIGSHRDRIDHHSAFKSFHLSDGERLFLDGEISVKDPNSAKLSKSDGHVGFGHGVHRRRQNWNVERNFAGEIGLGLRLTWKDRRLKRLQEDVVERQSERNMRNLVELGHIGP